MICHMLPEPFIDAKAFIEHTGLMDLDNEDQVMKEGVLQGQSVSQRRMIHCWSFAISMEASSRVCRIINLRQGLPMFVELCNPSSINVGETTRRDRV
jgi:hypothetical protein